MLKRMMKELLEEQYQRGYEAGRCAGLLERMEDHTRQLGTVYDAGVVKGYEDGLAKIGEIDVDMTVIDDLEAMQ